ncbi:MAG: EcsC family protein [Oscillospiraceae bacterium]|nr:EcsC family protein [Oscillospiraceae bacterium]
MNWEQFKMPTPVVDTKEADALDNLTKRYEKFIEPSKVAKLGQKAVDLVPKDVKELGSYIGLSISESEIYSKAVDLIGVGFSVIEEQIAQVSISEEYVLKQINNFSDIKIERLEEICFMRSYDLEKAISAHKRKNIWGALAEGGTTGVLGFWGLPFNIVFSTFLYFRAVQLVAMFYGYDVKNNSEELALASEVFTNALSPAKNDVNNEATSIIGKIMLMSQATVVKQTAKKTWTDMATHGGIPLLLTQIRALAHKSAERALENAGAKGLEHSLFKGAFEQIGKKLTLKFISRGVPVVSGFIGACIDTAQMKRVVEFANIFYQKRFIWEKKSRIGYLLDKSNIIYC